MDIESVKRRLLESEQCGYINFPKIEGSHFVCLLNDKYYYSNNKCYTFQEICEYYMQIQAKETNDLNDWELAMEIDSAREDYLYLHGHI